MNRKACKQQFKIEAKIICSAVEMATIASNVLAVQSGYFAQNPSVNLVMSGVGLVMAGAFFIKVNNKYFKSLVEQKLDDTFKKFEQQNSSKYNKYKAAAEIFAPVLIASRVVEKIRHLKHTASPR